MLANAEVQVATDLARFEIPSAEQWRLSRTSEISGAPDQPRIAARQTIEHPPGGFAGRQALGIGLELRKLLVPAIGQVALVKRVQLCGQRRISVAISRKLTIPFGCEPTAAFSDARLEMMIHALGDQKLRVLGPAISAFSQFDLVRSQRLAMSGRGVLLVGGPIGDMAVDDNEGGPIAGCVKALEGLRQGVCIIGIVDVANSPPVGAKASRNVLREGECGITLDGDVIVVIDPTQIREPQVASKRGRFAGHPFHNVTIAAKDVDVVIEQRFTWLIELGRKPAPGDGHAHAGATPLTQRAGGHLDARCVVVFRMPGAAAAELAELLDVIEGDRRRPARSIMNLREMQQRIEQHGGVAV